MKAIQFVCALALALALLPASSAYADESRAQSGSTVEAPTSIRAELIRIASTPGYRLGQVLGTVLFSPNPGKSKRPSMSPAGPTVQHHGLFTAYDDDTCGNEVSVHHSCAIACGHGDSFKVSGVTLCIPCDPAFCPDD